MINFTCNTNIGGRVNKVQQLNYSGRFGSLVMHVTNMGFNMYKCKAIPLRTKNEGMILTCDSEKGLEVIMDTQANISS